MRQRLLNALILIVICGVIIFVKNAYNENQKRQALENLFPASSIQGAVGNIHLINVNESPKDIDGGKLVSADAIVSMDLTSQQVKPTAMGILKTLKEKYPDCKWFSVRIFDDERLVESALFIAMAEFKLGNISMTGGIPSDIDIAAFNKSPLNRNNRDWSINSRDITLRKPTDEDIRISSEWWKEGNAFSKQEVGSSHHTSDDELDLIVAKKLSLPRSTVMDARKVVFDYYSLNLGKKIS